MESNTNPTPADELREGLLAQEIPAPDRMAAYRKEIGIMLDRNEKGLRREKRYVVVLWIFLVAVCTAFLVVGGMRPNTPLGTWFGVLACFWMIFGAVELLKHFINRSRVETLKEIKGVELRLLELQDLVRGGRDGK